MSSVGAKLELVFLNQNPNVVASYSADVMRAGVRVGRVGLASRQHPDGMLELNLVGVSGEYRRFHHDYESALAEADVAISGIAADR